MNTILMSSPAYMPSIAIKLIESNSKGHVV